MPISQVLLFSSAVTRAAVVAVTVSSTELIRAFVWRRSATSLVNRWARAVASPTMAAFAFAAVLLSPFAAAASVRLNLGS